MSQPRIAIVSAVRTATGTFGGTLKDSPASELGSIAVKAALCRAGIEPSAVDEVILGNVYQAGAGPNPARIASRSAGLPDSTPAMTINKLCGSGLKAVALGAQAILAGDSDIIVAGGMESMSRAPYVLENTRWGERLGHGKTIDTMLQDGLWDCFYDCHMGMTAENLAEKYSISREEQDRFAARSQELCKQAQSEGKFKDEIVAVEIPQRKGDTLLFNTDEHPRPDVTTDSLARLKPAFKKDGTVTPGNASGINDGAAAVILMNEDVAASNGIEPMAYIRAYATAGVDPKIMGIGPAPAIKKLLSKSQVNLGDINLIELNEAFAAQALAVGRELDWNEERVNVNGGAIALGHPIGASGARITVTLLHEMIRRDVSLGIAGLCIGGGMGIAMLFER